MFKNDILFCLQFYPEIWLSLMKEFKLRLISSDSKNNTWATNSGMKTHERYLLIEK